MTSVFVAALPATSATVAVTRVAPFGMEPRRPSCARSGRRRPTPAGRTARPSSTPCPRPSGGRRHSARRAGGSGCTACSVRESVATPPNWVTVGLPASASVTSSRSTYTRSEPGSVVAGVVAGTTTRQRISGVDTFSGPLSHLPYALASSGVAPSHVADGDARVDGRADEPVPAGEAHLAGRDARRELQRVPGPGHGRRRLRAVELHLRRAAADGAAGAAALSAFLPRRPAATLTRASSRPARATRRGAPAPARGPAGGSAPGRPACRPHRSCG